MPEHGTIMTSIGGDGGTVDTRDLKSLDRKVVRVRVPLAPLPLLIFILAALAIIASI
jgi:hypothetical protein